MSCAAYLCGVSQMCVDVNSSVCGCNDVHTWIEEAVCECDDAFDCVTHSTTYKSSFTHTTDRMSSKHSEVKFAFLILMFVMTNVRGIRFMWISTVTMRIVNRMCR
ncbi:hypothetical protein Smp_107450 [Schistosoma mansoni]|uniref:hypothetical protein n=1 Tax=Schistosoma mansoni TaxID=6183 RepID=UPI00022C86B1|nr:hypothetical protein Smp_107450 [Schistosoma mansoni]|eukprot:XP_018644047.1 hypothetical protein Smp_107450 [Schistosoma mansoni]